MANELVSIRFSQRPIRSYNKIILLNILNASFAKLIGHPTYTPSFSIYLLILPQTLRVLLEVYWFGGILDLTDSEQSNRELIVNVNACAREPN